MKLQREREREREKRVILNFSKEEVIKYMDFISNI